MSVPQYGGFCCFDHGAAKFIDARTMRSFAIDWFKDCMDGYMPEDGEQLRKPSPDEMMELVAGCNDWGDWEFLQCPENCGFGIVLENDAKRIMELAKRE